MSEQKIPPCRSLSQNRVLRLSQELFSEADRFDPSALLLGDERSAMIRPYEIAQAPQDEQIRQRINYVSRVECAFDTDQLHLRLEIIKNVEGAKRPPITRPILRETFGAIS